MIRFSLLLSFSLMPLSPLCDADTLLLAASYCQRRRRLRL